MTEKRIVRSIRRRWYDGVTIGKALCFGRVEIGCGFVLGKHYWIRFSSGRTQEDHGWKAEFQLWRIICGAVWVDAPNAVGENTLTS